MSGNKILSWIKKFDESSKTFGVFITNIVGTMYCAYVFTILALIGLPAALKPNGMGIVAWIAQTFLQLVLLSIIMVGQQVMSAASDVRMNNAVESIMKQFQMNQEELTELKQLNVIQSEALEELKSLHADQHETIIGQQSLIAELHAMHIDMLGKVNTIHEQVSNDPIAS